jgi:hypothetical protein
MPKKRERVQEKQEEDDGPVRVRFSLRVVSEQDQVESKDGSAQ